MVPPTLVKKIYGEQALYEAINGVVSEQLDKFLQDNDLHILGEPIASESQKEQEWKDCNDFEFKFDLGLSPAIDIDVTKEDKICLLYTSAIQRNPFYAEKGLWASLGVRLSL